MEFNVADETSSLKSVIIGVAKNSGKIPDLKDLYDPKSVRNLKNNSYPSESDLKKELSEFITILKKYNVTVYRPKDISDINQIFIRDVGFVIDNFFFKSNIIPKRDKEYEGIKNIIKSFDSELIELPIDIHIEGGDVINFNNYLFIGYYEKKNYSKLYTARTNKNAIDFFKKFFPKKIIKPFHLNKSNTIPENNALHLDCCLQIVGQDNAIMCSELFTNKNDVVWLKSFFGEKNIFFADKNEMSSMYCNVLSINRNTVVSQPSFKRLNNWLKDIGYCVEVVDFSEVSKQGGSFRCCSLPLIRY